MSDRVVTVGSIVIVTTRYNGADVSRPAIVTSVSGGRVSAYSLGDNDAWAGDTVVRNIPHGKYEDLARTKYFWKWPDES